MYKFLIRPILFLWPPESVHHFSTSFLKIAFSIPGVSTIISKFYKSKSNILEKEILGLKFKSPVGLAAGFDKDASMIDDMSNFGFGFIEIGTITPKAQPGNPKPRLFRLKKDQAIINRMGFNNHGVSQAVERLKKRKSKVIVGGNIGKNKVTPNEDAISDYTHCLDELYDYVDYFVVNVSSPNTPNLRELQEKEPLKQLLISVKEKAGTKEVYKPILLKIAPDLNDSQLKDIVEILKETRIDGIIATNTTISRAGLKEPKTRVEEIGAGGLSGHPLTERSTEVIRFLRNEMGPGYPIIGVGGIMSPNDALDKLKAGADLIQLYTGFIYEGPSIVKKINKAIIVENQK